MKTFSIIIFYILALAISSHASQQAVLIGIDHYMDESRAAPPESVSYTRELSGILSRNGYECRTLTDSEASKEQINEAFIQLEQKVSQSIVPDVFLFYFSGRGTIIPDDILADETQDGMDECILPFDAQRDNTLSFIRDDTLGRWISAVKAKRTLIILDYSFWEADGSSGVKELEELSVSDGLPENLAIISALSPEGSANHRTYTSKLLEACSSEDADIDGDRLISFAEAHQYVMNHLQGQQIPKVTGNLNMPLGALPVLSRLQIGSKPENAEILIYSGSQQLPLEGNTPSTVALKKGKYGIQAQKPGYIASDIRQVSIDEYDKVYIPEPFVLIPIKVSGRINIMNNGGKSISLGEKQISLNVTQSGEKVYDEMIAADAQFTFASDSHPWLKVASEYEISIGGIPVLSSEPVLFTYDGYSNIKVNMNVKIDDASPIFQEVTFESSKIVLGDVIKGIVKATDDGTGLDDVIAIQLRSPDGKTIIPIMPSDISFQKSDTYEFKYIIPDDKSAMGGWKVLSVTIRDKAGNQTIVAAESINAGFTVFENHYALGKHYFDSGDYANAMAHFQQFSPQDDDTLYMSSLAYDYQGNSDQALAAFQMINKPTEYLGDERKEMPRMPRSMVNRLWGRLLKDLKNNQKDAEYISLLVVTAQELGREYDAKVYREYMSQLKKN